MRARHVTKRRANLTVPHPPLPPLALPSPSASPRHQPNCGSDRSWVWSAFDFSDGDLLEEVFAIKFGTAENAQKFKDAFEAAQKEMARIMAGEDAAAGAAEADEAAAAIASLSTGEPSASGEPAPEPAAEPAA